MKFSDQNAGVTSQQKQISSLPNSKKIFSQHKKLFSPQRVAIGSIDTPTIAFFKRAFKPTVAVLMLILCTLAYKQPITIPYIALSLLVFIIAYHIFSEVEFSPISRLSAFQWIGRGILLEWTFIIAVLLVLAFAIKITGTYSRKVLLTWFVTVPFALIAAQALLRKFIFMSFARNGNTRTQLIVGANELGFALAARLNEDPSMGSVVGFFDDRNPERLPGLATEDLLGNLDDLVDYVRANNINVVYISLPIAAEPRLLKLLDELRDTTASVYFVPDIFFFDLIQARFIDINGIPVVAICETPFQGINALLKRVSDVLLALLISILIWPVLLIIAFGIKFTSPGPILFKQRRYGLDGEEILVYKFRTMTVCEDGSKITQATKNDQRVTRFGSFLRKTSLDELPQLINVLENKMSIVGPRPHAVAHNEEYRKLINGYMLRHKVKPGITGWAQVNGLRGETDTIEKMGKRVAYDLDYLKNWSILLDLKIIFKTVFVIFQDRNAY